MHTIVFYSYKGGTGRTLAVSQLAMLMNEYGIPAVAMDFDLGSPCMWEKLAPAIGASGRRPGVLGLVDYIDKHREQQELQTLRSKSENIGSVDLLTPGDPFDKENHYWKTYLKPKLQSFLAEDVGSDRLIVAIKAKIVEDFNDPKYLLIDAPSGVSRLAAMAIELLADTVVFLTANHHEGFKGTNFILKRLDEARSRGHRVPAIKCALTRVARIVASGGGVEAIRKDELERIRAEALRNINYGLRESGRVKELFMLSSEPILELNETLPMMEPMADPRLDGSPLIGDYIDLFSDLVEPLAGHLAHRRGKIRTLRTFMLLEEEGRMLNPVDRSANVALRVDTLVSTFAAIMGSVSSSVGLSAANDVLAHAGWTAADHFANYLKDRWQDENAKLMSPLSATEKIERWCAFDSTVGFGKFSAALYSGEMEGVITLDNSFLVAEGYRETHGLCALMTGYVQRILGAVFEGDGVEVEHNIDHSRIEGGDEAATVSCLFEFKHLTSATAATES